MAQSKKSKSARTSKSSAQAPRKTKRVPAKRVAVKKSAARKITKPRKTTTHARAPKTIAAPGTLSIETTAPAQGIPPHILVFIPGFMGSQLRDRQTKEIVWLDFSKIPLNPLEWGAWLDGLFEKMNFANDRLEPAGIIEDVLFLPPLVKQEQYSRLLTLLKRWGYRLNPEGVQAERIAYTFTYDWRQNNRKSGQQLGDAVRAWHAQYPNHQIWLMGHSNGGIIARWFIEKEGGKDIVDRLILLASPWDGAAKGLYALLNGVDTFLRWGFDPAHIGERTRATLRGFPNIYSLLPQARAFVTGPHEEPLDPFDGDKWLHVPELYPLLADGKAFNQELGNQLSVETLAFFGRKLKTTTGARVTLDANARWNEIEFLESDWGDGTVPEYSASYPHAQKNIPVVAEHGSVYTNSALQEILRWELLDKYTGAVQTRAALMTDRFSIEFNPDKSSYRPGEMISIGASILQNENQEPYTAATIFAELSWVQPLPGSPETNAPKKLPDTQLTMRAPGQFDGELSAPAQEGYYRLRGIVIVPGEPELSLEEIIAVENMP
jgi:pimeloyl-ACP methyl ester carboxylesterase